MGTSPKGKLAQALVYGAEVLAIRGNFDRALDIVREAADRFPVTLVNSVNPLPTARDKKPLLSKLLMLSGRPQDWLCIPMGNAGNITAYWMGFQEYHQAGHSRRLPRMMGFQASGSAPLVYDTTVSEPNTDRHSYSDW
jgi:threonine synthase